MSSKKRNFVLKNIDVNAINTNYGLTIISNLSKEKEDSKAITNITDVISQDIEYSITFLDENKKEVNCVATMIDSISNNKLPSTTFIKCFWCKNNFDWIPIGCPIKYVNPLIEKSYISQITKDKYYMRENIVKSKLKNLMNIDNIDQNFEITTLPFDHYLTDGVFCSFNCCLSFIKDNPNDILYKESYSLLHSMYFDLVGKNMAKIIPSPHWRLLKDFGGHLSIDDFRKNLNIVDYKFMFNLRDMHSISKVYKQKS
jgi:hypothetical protein